MEQDVLRAAPNVKRAEQHEGLRAPNVALGEGLREASAVLHAKQPAAFDAWGAG